MWCLVKDNMETFSKSAENLSKNPLGIIGLFLVLVYGIAGLVLITANDLGNERVFLIIFLTIFPLIILLVFYNLVTKHYNKLYSPSDYKDEVNFMKAIDKETNIIKQIQVQERVEEFEKTENDNTLLLIEELHSQVKLIASSINNIQQNEGRNLKSVSTIIEVKSKLLEEAKQLNIWKGTVLQVNDLLPKYTLIRDILGNRNIPINKYFGSTSKEPRTPIINLVTFGSDVPLKNIKIILSLAKEIGIDYVNLSRVDINRNGIYIGAYGYEYNKVAKLDELLAGDWLEKDTLTLEQVHMKLKEKLNYDFTSKGVY